MDVFPSIESTNNVLVRLVAAFNKVEDSINQNGFDVANQIRRLRVSENWDDRDEDDVPAEKLTYIPWFIMTVTTTALVMASLLVSYWLLCQTLQDFLTKR